MNFAQGLAALSQGYQQGQQRAQQLQAAQLENQAKLQQIQAAAQQMKAQAAAGSGLIDDGSGGGGQAAPQPGPQAAPPQAAPQGAPMQGGLPQRMAPPPSAPGVQPARPSLPPAQPSPGAGGGAPGAGPAPAPGAGPQAQGAPMQSGVAQPTGNMVKDARTTIKSIAADILRRNPQLKNDPATLMAAVNQTITSMKGLEPEMRDYMGLEAKLAQVQAAGEAAVLKAKTSEEATAAKLDIATKQMAILQAKVESYERVQKGHDQARTAVAGTAASARVQSAGIAAKGGTDRANIAAGASRDVAGTRADAARDVAGTRADASTSGARINASMGKSDAPAPRAGRTAPVRVQTPAQAQALKPGTHYITPDGQELIR